ncbi:MAG: DUF2089 family protein [Candidatus Cloacimonetes bacterium]|nr:DUF2089 domain-containing protein [Candidatus Cloacimonadota bacterium]MDD2506588.1 DUF2089 family protein [Candidatus Cloacimonadota bacterium]MDD4147056.1 DUF2089 family protein [Candidatus Cloacimonadota bacterium]MDD4560210.1 DUF2089 family protein [Candidatus Cloacimonadota bacterium]
MNLANCPICHKELVIREYHCPSCKVSFEGDFSRNWLEGFTASQLEFIKLFLLVQGNLKELQKRLGISYPTVKNRLSEIIGIITREDGGINDYTDILTDLEGGFINVEEAVSMIQKRREQ